MTLQSFSTEPLDTTQATSGRAAGLKLPCKTCPWRVDRSAQDIPNFSLALAERLAATSPDERHVGPALGAPQFACHQSELGKEVVCRGWLAAVGHRHPMVRLAVLQGRLPAEALSPGPDWPVLHETYPQVLEKLRQTCGEPKAEDSGPSAQS